MLTLDQMKELVDEIIDLGNQLRTFHGHGAHAARPYPPGSSKNLAVFRGKHAQLPPSYLQLLSIYDGIANFDWVDVALLSSDYLLTQPDPTAAWIDGGSFAKGERFIFAQSDTDSHAIAFLTDPISDDGEMEVIDFDSDGPVETYQHLEAYLLARHEWFANAVAGEKADRAGLADDE